MNRIKPPRQPRKVAIFMSDFHLGQTDEMEEFHADYEFSELLERLSIEHARNNDQVDLILLGDVMDLWTTILDGNEVKATTADKVKLYFPATNKTDALNEEKEKVVKILEMHCLFFKALARFLVDDSPRLRQIYYVPGNHDHSVVHSEIQEEIRKAIVAHGHAIAQEYAAEQLHGFVSADFPGRIKFQNYYLEHDLQVYAEHGNQLTYGGTYRYELPEDWLDQKRDREKCKDDQFGKECPGYYELKLIWNRLERKAPELDNVFMGALSPAMWPGLFWWLLFKGNIQYWSAFKQFYAQYKQYERSKPVQDAVKAHRLSEKIVQAVASARTAMPSPWRSVLHLLRARWHATKDEFWHQVPQMFDHKGAGKGTGEIPLCGHRLNPRDIKTVVLGHSHHAKDEALRGSDFDEVRYFNTGSWIYRYENGRGIIEQTWVTISRDLPSRNKKNASPRRDIDRQMIRRKVELPCIKRYPYMHDGPALNPDLRKMDDLKVGDILLIRGNYGATIRRLLMSFQIGELFRFIPSMVLGWFNRYGTFSNWNHLAIVYGSPSEPSERNLYNDVLIIEAVPDVGVAIHGPQHYLEYPTEHDLAVLRPKARWFQDWDNRLLLRRLTLSRLEAHYDLNVIMNQTLAHTISSMDRQGRSVIAGLVKGALFGLMAGVLLLAPLSKEITAATLKTWGKDLHQAGGDAWTWIITHLGWSAIPVDDWVLKLGVYALILLFSGIAALTIYKMLRVVVLAWAYTTAALGAAIGVLIVPVMAELSNGWSDKSPAWRWCMTVIWLAFVGLGIGTVLTYWSVIRDVSWFREYLPSDDGLKTLAALLILSTALTVTTAAQPVTKIAEWLVLKPGGFIASKVLALARRVRRWLGFTTSNVPSEFQAVDKQFICSSLAQYALERTAIQINKEPDEVRVYDQAKEHWSDVLPKHFSASDKFDWIYLFVHGKVNEAPSQSMIAQANPEPFLTASRRLIGRAAWSFRLSLLGLLFMLMFHYGNATFLEVPALNPRPSLTVLWYGIGCVLGALWCARSARIRLALQPDQYRGRALIWWGQRICTIIMGMAIIELGLSWSHITWDLQTIAFGIAFLTANALLLF